MAKIDREFLVPYLENLCALHIAKWKVEQKKSEIAGRRNSVAYKMNCLSKPREPYYEETGFHVFSIILGVILIIVSFLDILIISFLAGLLGWLFVIVGAILLFRAKVRNEDMQSGYESQVMQYNNQLEILKREADEVNTYAFVQYSLCQAEMEEIEPALQKVYAANVIPRRYRDIYVAVYLYDWFSTGMSDDVDLALNMYVLEEIKDRLDQIIDMLSRSLLNQKLIIDNQNRSMEQQRQYQKKMMAKLDRMQTTAEEHSRYLAMIEANTAATAYFCAAEYVRKL